MDEICEFIVSQGQGSFANQATPGGEPWLPSRRAQIEGGQTLADSEKLLANLSDDMEIEADTVAVGSIKVYAVIHQLCGQIGRSHAVKLLARAYLPDEDSLSIRPLGSISRRLPRDVSGHYSQIFSQNSSGKRAKTNCTNYATASIGELVEIGPDRKTAVLALLHLSLGHAIIAERS